MASIKDALEETIQDKHSVIKITLVSLPLFYCVTSYIDKNTSGLEFLFIVILTGLLLFGFLATTTRNVRSGLDHILPTFNIFEIYWNAIKGLIALGPTIVVAQLLASFLSKFVPNFQLQPSQEGVVLFIIYAISYSMVLTGYALYGANMKIADAYNFNSISKYCIDILIYVLFMIFLLILANGLLVGVVTYLLWLFFGLTSKITIYFWCFAAVYNLGVIGHYIAQISYEVIETKEDNKKN